METETVKEATPIDAAASFSLFANSFFSTGVYPGKVITVICMTYKIFQLPPCQINLVRRRGKRPVDVTQIFFCQRNIKTSGIFLHMGDAACLGYGDDIPCAHYPCQHDLRGSGIMPAGYLYQRLVIAQPSFTQRCVGHDRNFLFLAPRDKVVFDIF